IAQQAAVNLVAIAAHHVVVGATDNRHLRALPRHGRAVEGADGASAYDEDGRGVGHGDGILGRQLQYRTGSSRPALVLEESYCAVLRFILRASVQYTATFTASSVYGIQCFRGRFRRASRAALP